MTSIDHEAVQVLIDHQRLDIGNCLCGWGVNTGDLGRCHSLHVWKQLQPVLLKRDMLLRKLNAPDSVDTDKSESSES